MTHKLFAQPLQDGQGLVQGDRHGDLGEVFSNVAAEKVPEVHSGRVGFHGRKFCTPSGVPGTLNCNNINFSFNSKSNCLTFFSNTFLMVSV